MLKKCKKVCCGRCGKVLWGVGKGEGKCGEVCWGVGSVGCWEGVGKCVGMWRRYGEKWKSV